MTSCKAATLFAGEKDKQRPFSPSHVTFSPSRAEDSGTLLSLDILPVIAYEMRKLFVFFVALLIVRSRVPQLLTKPKLTLRRVSSKP